MARTSQSAPRNMREKKALARKSRSVSTDSPAPFLSLQAFISNAFFGLFIQDDDEIAEYFLERDWSRKVQEDDNGTPLNFEQFQSFIVSSRQQFSNRQFISQSFVVAPADAEGLTGQIAHTSHFSAIQQDKEVKGTIVAILKIRLEEGERKIETESFVLALDS